MFWFIIINEETSLLLFHMLSTFHLVLDGKYILTKMLSLSLPHNLFFWLSFIPGAEIAKSLFLKLSASVTSQFTAHEMGPHISCEGESQFECSSKSGGARWVAAVNWLSLWGKHAACCRLIYVSEEVLSRGCWVHTHVCVCTTMFSLAHKILTGQGNFSRFSLSFAIPLSCSHTELQRNAFFHCPLHKKIEIAYQLPFYAAWWWFNSLKCPYFEPACGKSGYNQDSGDK